MYHLARDMDRVPPGWAPVRANACCSDHAPSGARPGMHRAAPQAAAMALGLCLLGPKMALGAPPVIDVPAGSTHAIPGDYASGVVDGGNIAASGTLNLDSSSQLTNNGVLSNSGTLNLDHFSTLTNNGELANQEQLSTSASSTLTNAAGGQFSNHGQIDNEGALSNHGQLTNRGTLNNSNTVGTVDNYGTLTNYGQLNNFSTLDNHANSTLDNYGTLVNGWQLNNYGRLNNYRGSTLITHAITQLFNYFELFNYGTLINKFELANSGTLVNTGTLQNEVILSNASGSLLSNTGTLDNQGALTNDGSVINDGILLNSGTLTNNGTLINNGLLTSAGTIANTATGVLRIGTGGSSGTLEGNVDNAGAMHFQRSDASQYFGVLSGAGTLYKEGAGTLTLLGNSSGYAGNTLVTDGTLLLAPGSQLGGMLSVARGATLAGTGTVGSPGLVTTLQNGATVAPGTPTIAYGSLHIQGDLVLEPGTTYQVQANPDGSQASQLHISGTATLGGNVLHVGPRSSFALATPYLILSADGGISAGSHFSAALSSYAFVRPFLLYTPHTVTLVLHGVEDFASQVDTHNQQAVVRNIQGLGPGHVLYEHLVPIDKQQAGALANSLSGDSHASVASSLIPLNTHMPRVSLGQLRNSLTAGWYPGAPIAQSSQALPASAWPSSKALPAWAELMGLWQSYQSDGNAPRLKQRTMGVFAGMDEAVGHSGWRLGAALGYTYTDGRMADRSATAKIDSYSAALYGGKQWAHGTARISVLGGLSYTWHDISSERRVASLGQTLTAHYQAHTAQLFSEIGYALPPGNALGLEPFVGLVLGEQRTGRFREAGGSAALQGNSSTAHLASTTLGLHLHQAFQWAGKDGHLRATMGWRHAWGDINPSKTLAFEAGPSFTVTGAPLARNTALLKLEAEIAWSRNAALAMGLRSEIGQGLREQAAQIKLHWGF